MNHAVLYVRDAQRSAAYDEEVLGFREVVHDDLNRFSFLRAPRSVNHHDLALFTVSAGASPFSAGRGTVGLYHPSWEVPTLKELEEMHERLEPAGDRARFGAQSIPNS